MVFGDDVGAGGDLVGDGEGVIGEAEGYGLLGGVVELTLLVPDVGGAAFPDMADELVGLDPGAGLAVVGGGGVDAVGPGDDVLAVGSAALFEDLVMDALNAVHIKVGELGVGVQLV